MRKPTCEYQSTVYTEWCPGWYWPNGGRVGRSRSSRSFQGWLELSAGRSHPSVTSPLAHLQSPNFLSMWMTSCRASDTKRTAGKCFVLDLLGYFNWSYGFKTRQSCNTDIHLSNFYKWNTVNCFSKSIYDLQRWIVTFYITKQECIQW